MSLRTRLARWLLGKPPSLIGPPTPYQLERMTDLARIALAEGRPSAPIPVEWTLALLTAHRHVIEATGVQSVDAGHGLLRIDLEALRRKRLSSVQGNFTTEVEVRFDSIPASVKAEVAAYQRAADKMQPEMDALSKKAEAAGRAFGLLPEYLRNVVSPPRWGVPASAGNALEGGQCGSYVPLADVLGAWAPTLLVGDYVRKIHEPNAGAQGCVVHVQEPGRVYICKWRDAIEPAVYRADEIALESRPPNWRPPTIGGFTANRDGGRVECAAYLGVGSSTDAAVEAFNAACADALRREGETWEAEGTPMVRVSRSWRKVDFDPEVRLPHWKVPAPRVDCDSEPPRAGDRVQLCSHVLVPWGVMHGAHGTVVIGPRDLSTNCQVQYDTKPTTLLWIEASCLKVVRRCIDPETGQLAPEDGPHYV